MDVVLFIECEKRKEDFEYKKEISEDEYVKMLQDASESILGHDGFTKKQTLDRKYGFYDVTEMEQYYQKPETEEIPFKGRIFQTNGDDFTLEAIKYYWNSNSPFILFLEVDEIESPIAEDEFNIWVTNSDYINNDETLNEYLILTSLKSKHFKVKLGNLYFTLKHCKMVDKISGNKYAILVNNMER